MIQRIQSLYILVAVFLCSLLLYGNIGSFADAAGAEYELRFNGLYQFAAGSWNKTENVIPLAIMLVSMPLFSLVTLLLYKFRKLQIRAAIFTLLLLIGEVLLLAWYLFYASVKYDASVIFNLKISFPLVSAILMYLAFRGILKDELLIRSFDRIR
ncbi:MAG: DUF4293 domain-containing protein [Bacteroidales bacterium]|jgi:hypothetical protein|nr:DUF4293 domain-containing protein [Bacteroidales bacterium]